MFEKTPDIWSRSPEYLRDALIAVGQIMSPALEVVIENHVDTAAPIIIEGDSILPSLFARPSIRERARNGQVQAVFLVEPEEDVLIANMMTRNRGIAGRTDSELRTETHAKWLYGHWLANEARTYGLPVIEPRPWGTVLERILTACQSLHVSIKYPHLTEQ